MGLTFSNYVLQPFFNDCAVPVEATQLLAAATICKCRSVRRPFIKSEKFYSFFVFAGFLTFINCYDVKFTTKLQNLFMFTKIAALVLVIIVGVYHMSMGKCQMKTRWSTRNFQFRLFACNNRLGNVENFDKPFENTETHLGKLSVAFYSGIFSYAGWYVCALTHAKSNEFFIKKKIEMKNFVILFAGIIWILWQRNCVSHTKIYRVPFIYRCHWWRQSMFWQIWHTWQCYQSPKCLHRMQLQWYASNQWWIDHSVMDALNHFWIIFILYLLRHLGTKCYQILGLGLFH